MKINRFLTRLALIGVLAACDSPLDTDPTNAIDAEVALTSARGVELSLNGAYRALQGIYGRVEVAFPDMYSDNLEYTGTFTGDREVSIRAITATNGEVSAYWVEAYRGINRANYILEALGSITDPALTAEKKNQYRGEALWVRGLNYSLLAKYYGGVPLVDAPARGVDENALKARSTLPETYAFIEKDLEEAATLLGPARANGRATQGAANALLARIYLEQGKNDKALAKATAVIANPIYRLAPTYREYFTNKNSVESIYDVQYSVNNQNSTAFWFFPTGSLGGRYGFAPSLSLFNAYEASDTRRAATIAVNGTSRYGFKYYRVATGDDNIPVARLAEQYLIRAEANARLGAPTATVHADINVIRARAGLAPLAATVTTQPALLDAILQERRVELALEGFRFSDLRRHGKAQTLLGISADKLLWPVPQFERDVNPNLTQNAGY